MASPAKNVPVLGGPNHRYFIRIFNTTLSDFLIIPAQFVNDHIKDVPKAVTVVTSDSVPWPVNMERLNDIVYLDKGWTEFTKAYSINAHNILLFGFDQDKEFLVTIFDYPGVVKQIQYTPPLDVTRLLANLTPQFPQVAAFQPSTSQIPSHMAFDPAQVYWGNPQLPTSTGVCLQLQTGINIEPTQKPITTYTRRRAKQPSTGPQQSQVASLRKYEGPDLQLALPNADEFVNSTVTKRKQKRKAGCQKIRHTRKNLKPEDRESHSGSNHSNNHNGPSTLEVTELTNDVTKDRTQPISAFFLGETIVQPSVQSKRKTWPTYSSYEEGKSSTANHCYIIMMRISVARPFIMELPVQFMAATLKYGQTEVTLIIKTKSGIKAFNVTCYRATATVALTSGWEDFVNANSLKPNDCCRFQIKHAATATLLVEIIRGFGDYISMECEDGN